MGNSRLRWLTRQKAETVPSHAASERLVPSWLEVVLATIARTPPDAVDWTQLARLVRDATGAQWVRLWSVGAPGQLRLVAAEGQSVAVSPFRSAPVGFDQLTPEEQVGGDPAQLRPSALLSEEDLADLRREGIVQCLALPMLAAGRIVGRLELGRRRAEPFRREDRVAAALLAFLLAVGLAGAATAAVEPQKVRAEPLLEQALANVFSVREALARLCEALRWQARADVVLLVRWQPEERPELIVATGETTILPDPAALGTPQVIATLRDVLAAGRSVRRDGAAELALLFPREVAGLLVVPFPVSVAQARGLLIAAWQRKLVDEVAQAHALVEKLVPALVSLLAWSANEERALAIAQQARWLEDVLGTLLVLSDPVSLSRLVWHLVSRAYRVQATALVVVDGDDQYWFWIADGVPQPGRRLSRVRVPAVEQALEGRSRVLGPEEREQWQVVLPHGLRADALLVVPFPSGVGALVVAAEPAETLSLLEAVVHRLAPVLAHAGADLRERARRALVPDQRGRALLEVLTAGESERRELVETIHTAVLQGLASTLYRIELTLRRADQQALEQTVLELEQVRDQLAEQIATLRDAVFRLRPASLEHLGVVAALREYLAQLERARGIMVEFLGELPARLRPDLEEVLYRVVQTLIERARLPAGIQRLVVRLRQQRDGSVLLVVADDGPWPGDEAWSEQPGVALVGEWVQLLGGTIRATGLPGQGTTVAITLRPEAVPPLTRVPIGTIR